jgi:tetratricopeptide (TPR) repeat protein
VSRLGVGFGIAWLVFGLGQAVARAATPVDCALSDQEGPGVVDPFHVPSDAAKQLNADALAFYRQGRWDDARSKYRAALAADPDFLAPAMNLACSFVRQERFPEAMAEVRRLLARAFTPWNDEVLTAADLGALKVGTMGKELRALLEEGRRHWAEGL